MNAEYDKTIFAKNLRNQMDLKQKNSSDICELLSVSRSTVSDWLNAKKMPRMDKVEILANFFHILKSDLIEEKKKDSPPDFSFYYDLSEESQAKLKEFAQFLLAQQNKE